MAVIRMLARAESRQRFKSWLVLALLVALVSGLVLAAAAAGRRTSSAFPRFVAAHGFDIATYNDTPDRRIADLPEVASSITVRSVSNGTPRCACTHAIKGSDLSVQEVGRDALPRLVKLLAGRLPRRDAPHEVLASFSLESDAGVHVGTVVRVPFFSASQRGTASGPSGADPVGRAVALRVVGVETSEVEFPSGNTTSPYELYATHALDRLLVRRPLTFTEYYIRLRNGPADLSRFQADVRHLNVAGLQDEDTAAATIASSIRPQAVGWWVLAALAALAGMLVIAQALSRQGALENETYDTLRSLGVSRRQLFAVGMVRTLAVAVLGVVGGVTIAYLLSPLTPVGVARVAEPSTGFAVDWTVVLLGGLGAVLVAIALGIWPALRAAQRHTAYDAQVLGAPSPLMGLVPRLGAAPSMSIGIRRAIVRGHGRNAVPVGSALFGAVLAVTALCATAVFGTSLSHLTTTPALYGQPFDIWLDYPESAQVLHSLRHDPGIDRVTEGFTGDVVINRTPVDAIAGSSLRGSVLLTAVSGRLPAGPDEIALGARTLHQVGARVGSAVMVRVPDQGGGTRTIPFQVVGTVSFPPDFGAGGLGTGAVFTTAGYLGAQCPPGPDRSDCEAGVKSELGGGFLIKGVAGPAGHAAVSRLARRYPDHVNYPVPPTNLVNFGEAVNFPLIVGSVLIVFGAATLLHVLVVSVGRRRQEIALLKTLGFVRRQTAFVVVWQAMTVALVGIALGVPLGIAAGREVWRLFAMNLGVLPVTVVNGNVIVALVIGTVIVANVLAIVPALAAARLRPATCLRTP